MECGITVILFALRIHGGEVLSVLWFELRRRQKERRNQRARARPFTYALEVIFHRADVAATITVVRVAVITLLIAANQAVPANGVAGLSGDWTGIALLDGTELGTTVVVVGVSVIALFAEDFQTISTNRSTGVGTLPNTVESDFLGTRCAATISVVRIAIVALFVLTDEPVATNRVTIRVFSNAGTCITLLGGTNAGTTVAIRRVAIVADLVASHGIAVTTNRSTRAWTLAVTHKIVFNHTHCEAAVAIGDITIVTLLSSSFLAVTTNRCTCSAWGRTGITVLELSIRRAAVVVGLVAVIALFGTHDEPIANDG
jgi:hypothetical protein